MQKLEPDPLQQAVAAHERGDLPTAERIYREILARRPESFDALHLLGVIRAQQGRFAEAERLIARALALDASDARAHNHLGAVLTELGRTPEALQSFRRALARKPDYPEAEYNLANALKKAERHEEAVEIYLRVLARRPEFVPATFNLIDALRHLGRQEEALAHVDRLLEGHSEDAEAHMVRGLILRELGQGEAARGALARALDLDPTATEAYLHLVSMEQAPDQRRLAAMESLASRGDLPPDRKALLLFALAHAEEKLGRDDAAFGHLLEANRLRRSQLAYDEAPARRRFERLRQAFTADLLAGKAGRGAESDLPVFIVGFPRSGTTLAEQILASHPEVHGAGELGYLGQIAAGMGAGGQPFPECLAALEGAELRRCGEAYVQRLKALAPQARRITDKLPDNYMFIGLIRLILPRARIIHLSRDPLDTCLSCFSQHFTAEINYAYDLTELGRYHRMYLDLMEHWRRVLPPGAMLEVRYEELVGDIEGQARRMLDYCGLAWDPRCVAFHENRRRIRTASVDQVRRPLYRSSVQRWRRYEARLRPLMEALAAQPAAPPAGAAPAAPRAGPAPSRRQELLQRARRAPREGKLATAEKLYRRLLADAPGDFDALHLLGVIRAQQRRFGEAETLLARAAAANPASPEVHNNLGNVRLELGRAEEAATLIGRALELRPSYAEARYNLANALRKLERTGEAIAAYQGALALKPDYRDALFNLADLLRSIQQPEPAIEALRRLLAAYPADPEAHGLLGIVLRQAGRMDEAMAAFDRALALNPRFVGIHYNRVRSLTVRDGDPQLAVMERLAARKQELGEADRGLLHMALGKAYEDLGRYDRAFENYLAGKRLRRRLAPYDEARQTDRADALRRSFTRERLAAAAGHGSPSELPIFVVGFPRSGTTLIEQILASHPAVHGAGELGYLDHIAARFRAAAAPDLGYPDYAAHLSPAECRALGEAYVDRLRSLDPGATRITDKLPENFANVGLIRLILPRARIVHVQRDPLDTCVSCFTISFSGGLAYTSDLAELGRAYRRYLDLMAHWRAVLPADAMLEVRYEELIADLEGEARRLLEHCGLPWDPRCLAFHETRRSVRTASVDQVRQPLYRSSLQRWRRYERHLGPLIEALGPAATESIGRGS